MKKIFLILPIILLLAAGCGSTQNLIKENSISTSAGSAQVRQQTQSLTTYSNPKYNFQLTYPNNWILTENGDYISIKPTAKSESNFSIATVNVGRESAFDLAAKVKIQDTTLAGKTAKIYDCKQQTNGCSTNISADVAVHLLDLPASWDVWNEIDYIVFKSENINVTDFQQILNSIKFTETTNNSGLVGKLYINNRVGYQFEYPTSDFKMLIDETIKYPDPKNPNKDLVQFGNQRTYSVQTYVGAMKNFKSLTDWIASAVGPADNNILHYYKQTIGGQEAYLYNDSAITYVGYNGNVYEIIVYSGIAPAQNDNDPTYNSLLSSFKFTN